MRIVRFTLSRQDRKRRAIGLGALACGVGGATALAFAAQPGALSTATAHTYAVRIALLPRAPESVAARPAELAVSSPLAAALATQPQIPPTDAPPTAVVASSGAVPLAARAKVAGMLPLDYSLSGGAEAGDAIEVEKPVSLGGTDVGRIPLRIDGNAKVYALGSKLAEIIARQSGEKSVPAGLVRDFVSLERLRALGIAVRYDAVRDRLVVDPPAA